MGSRWCLDLRQRLGRAQLTMLPVRLQFGEAAAYMAFVAQRCEEPIKGRDLGKHLLRPMEKPCQG